MNELRACPWCGKTDSLRINVNPTTLYVSVYCEDCGCSMKRKFVGNDKIVGLATRLMVEAWNTRKGENDVD